MLPMLITILRFGKAIKEEFADPEFRALLFLVVLTLGTGTVFYHNVEHWRWLDSLYFSVITLATVGYGDFTPHTDLGKIFTMFYIFVGIASILEFINLLAKHQSKSLTKDKEQKS